MILIILATCVAEFILLKYLNKKEKAYFKPQTVTTGFDVWTDYQKTTDTSAEIKFKYFGSCDKYTMVVTLSDRAQYTAYLDGKEISFNERNKGSLEFTFKKDVKGGVLEIKEK